MVTFTKIIFMSFRCVRAIFRDVYLRFGIPSAINCASNCRKKYSFTQGITIYKYFPLLIVRCFINIHCTLFYALVWRGERVKGSLIQLGTTVAVLQVFGSNRKSIGIEEEVQNIRLCVMCPLCDNN